MSKRSRTDTLVALSTQPFARLAVQLVRAISTFLPTGDWMRLVPSLPSGDREKVLQFVTQQYYDRSAAGLIRRVAVFQRMMTFTVARLTKLTLMNVGVVPELSTWLDVLQHAQALVDIVWVDSAVEAKDTVDGHLRALSFAARRLQSLEIGFFCITESLDAPLSAGLLVDRDLGMRPLKTLRFSCGKPLRMATALKILPAFRAMTTVSMSCDWNDQVLRSVPLSVTSLMLKAKEPRDWPDVKSVQPFFDQGRPGAWQLFSLRQGHLVLEIERSEEDGLPMFDLLAVASDDFDVDEHSPATLFPPTALLEYWTRLFPKWKKIDVNLPGRQQMRVLVPLAEWSWFDDNRSAGDVSVRRDQMLATDEDGEWDDAKTPWFDEDDIKPIARAIKAGGITSVSVTNEYSEATEQPMMGRFLQATKSTAAFSNLNVASVLPWLRALAPFNSELSLVHSQLTWTTDDLRQLVKALGGAVLQRIMLAHGTLVGGAVHLESQVFPTRELIQWLPSSRLESLHLERYPLDDPATLCRGTLSKIASLRIVSLCSRRPIGRDELLCFRPELESLSWTVRASDESKEPLNEQLMMAIAQRYRKLDYLELDIRPTQLRAQPPESTFWRDWIALLPDLRRLVLALDSGGFTWNERHMLRSVTEMVVRLVAPSEEGRLEPYHRYAAPMDRGDGGGLRWANQDDMDAIPMEDGLRRWPQRLVYARPDSDLKWPEMWIADDDVQRTDREDLIREYALFLLGDDSPRWQVDHKGLLLFDYVAKTVEHLTSGRHHWRRLTAAIQGKQGWSAQAGWPNTWYRSDADEGKGDYDMYTDETIFTHRLAALYLTMRVLNPDVAAQRIGQALYRPLGPPAIYSRFEAFFFATNRRLLNAPPTGAAAAPESKGGVLTPALLESKAMTDQRLLHIEHARRDGTLSRIERKRDTLEMESLSQELPTPTMQLLARDAARLASAGSVDQVRFRAVTGL